MSGVRLWNMDVGTGIHYPIVYQGVLIFGASDGKFYGLDLQSGTMSATTKVDSQNLFSLVNRDNALTVFPNRLALNVNEFIGALVSQNKPNSKLP